MSLMRKTATALVGTVALATQVDGATLLSQMKVAAKAKKAEQPMKSTAETHLNS